MPFKQVGNKLTGAKKQLPRKTSRTRTPGTHASNSGNPERGSLALFISPALQTSFFNLITSAHGFSSPWSAVWALLHPSHSYRQKPPPPCRAVLQGKTRQRPVCTLVTFYPHPLGDSDSTVNNWARKIYRVTALEGAEVFAAAVVEGRCVALAMQPLRSVEAVK